MSEAWGHGVPTRGVDLLLTGSAGPARPSRTYDRGGAIVTAADHEVAFYEGVDDLAAFAADYMRRAWTVGGDVVAIVRAANQERLSRIERPATPPGRFVVVDADQLLSALLDRHGHLRADRFLALVGGLIGDLAGSGRPLYVVGEMVDILWARDPDAAVELEELWNRLADTHRFTLCCLYRLDAVVHADDLAATHRLCDHHDAMRTPPGYRSGVAEPRTDDDAQPDQVTWVVLPVPEAIASIRRSVADALRAWGEVDLVEDAQLVVSELATNALRHAVTPFRVVLDRVGPVVVIGVEDRSPHEPAARVALAHQPHGRGIALVEQLAARWGTRAVDEGKVVWAELRR